MRNDTFRLCKPCTKRASSHIVCCTLSFSLLMCPELATPSNSCYIEPGTVRRRMRERELIKSNLVLRSRRNTLDLHSVVTTLGTISAWIQRCAKPAHTTTSPRTHRPYQRYSRLPDISLSKFRGISRAMSHGYAA
jgi:hypothetical protein